MGEKHARQRAQHVQRLHGARWSGGTTGYVRRGTRERMLLGKPVDASLRGLDSV